MEERHEGIWELGGKCVLEKEMTGRYCRRLWKTAPRENVKHGFLPVFRSFRSPFGIFIDPLVASIFSTDGYVRSWIAFRPWFLLRIFVQHRRGFLCGTGHFHVTSGSRRWTIWIILYFVARRRRRRRWRRFVVGSARRVIRLTRSFFTHR